MQTPSRCIKVRQRRADKTKMQEGNSWSTHVRQQQPSGSPLHAPPTRMPCHTTLRSVAATVSPGAQLMPGSPGSTASLRSTGNYGRSARSGAEQGGRATVWRCCRTTALPDSAGYSIGTSDHKEAENVPRSCAGAWSICGIDCTAGSNTRLCDESITCQHCGSLFAVRSRLELFNSREKYKKLCLCSCVCVFEDGTSAPMQSTLFHPRILRADEPTAPRCTFYWLGRIGEY